MPFACTHGDSTTRAAYDAALGSTKAHALITDPPYCLLTRRRKNGDERDKKGVKLDSGPVRRFEDVRAFRDFTRSWLSLAVERLVPTAPLVIWTNLLGRKPIEEVARELGWPHFEGEFVWGKKTREANSGEEILRVVETALVFRSAPIPPRDNAAPAIPWAVVAGYDDDGAATKWNNHPNHKPFGVVEPLLRTFSRPGDVVLDPFAGSGSIPNAARHLGRTPACIELEADWAELVTRRLNA